VFKFATFLKNSLGILGILKKLLSLYLEGNGLEEQTFWEGVLKGIWGLTLSIGVGSLFPIMVS